MKIKKFESFNNFFTTITELMDYYKCNNCNAFWKMFNEKQIIKCPHCESINIETIDSNQWYKLVKSKLKPDEIIEIDKDKDFEDNELIDLIKIGINKEKEKIRKNVN